MTYLISVLPMAGLIAWTAYSAFRPLLDALPFFA